MDRYIRVEIVGGVIGEKANRAGESGVYFYCNDRLVVRSVKDYEVGYSSGQAGLPNHPGAALGRIIVKLNGAAQDMPWNSSKSAINYQHKIFETIRQTIVDVVTYYVGLSRRTQGDWPNQIYKFKTGKIAENEIKTLGEILLHSPALPRTRKRFDEKVAEKNRKLARTKPWVVGLYEGIAAVELITRKNFKQKNRFALIMLDSTFEIALKEYLVNDIGIGMNKFRDIVLDRTTVITEVRKTITLPDEHWKQIHYYYNTRNNLMHLKATADVSDDDVANYRNLVEITLTELFGLRF